MKIKTRMVADTAFVSGSVVKSVVIKELDEKFQISKNFQLYELANNKSKDDVKAIWNDDVSLHCQMLQELRNAVGTLTVNSWFRTQSFNASVGGDKNSLHLKALATDLSFKKLSDSKYAILESAWRCICQKYGCIGGINRYSNGVHVSSREDLFGHKSFVTRDYRGKKGDW